MNLITESAESLTAYSHYLAMKGQSIGLTVFDGHKPSRVERELTTEIRHTCDRAKQELSHCKPEDIYRLTDAYSTLFLIGYRKIPDYTFMGKQRDRLSRYWEDGNRSVEESQIYGMMVNMIPTSSVPLTASQGRELNRMREQWIDALRRYGSFPEVNSYEKYQRLALIIRENTVSLADKVSWYERN